MVILVRGVVPNNDKAPSYLQELTVLYSACQLRSSNKFLLSHKQFHPTEIAVSQHVPQEYGTVFLSMNNCDTTSLEQFKVLI